jgi:N-acetylmuramoyl-L-alanine amidase
MMDYILYTIINLSCAYFIYRVFLRPQKTFQFNRFYLLITLLLCLISPIVELQFFSSAPSITEVSFSNSELIIEKEQIIDTSVVSKTKKNIDGNINYMLWFYLMGSMIFIIRFSKNLFQLYRLSLKSYTKHNSLKLIPIENLKNPSSFFNYLFINPADLKNKKFLKNVIEHEQVHSLQFHTLDVIFIEFVLCFFWFNPFVWLYRMAIKQNHEFIADELSIKSGIDINTYLQSIICSRPKEQRIHFASGFNFTQIKNRIIMLHQSKSTVLNRILKVGLTIVLFAGVFVLSSFKKSNEPLVVIIDAGHGGKDPGQVSGNIKEKDVVLNIANILKTLSNDDIKFVTTRQSDHFSSLSERINFINKQNPDLVISLHCNASSTDKESGVEAYYYKSDDVEIYSKSMEYSSLVSSELALNLGLDIAKISIANFKLLKEVKSPAFVLELGYLTNKNDIKKLVNNNNQKVIAETIFEVVSSVDN